jgi:hypothetical protein
LEVVVELHTDQAYLRQRQKAEKKIVQALLCQSLRVHGQKENQHEGLALGH